MSNTNAREEKEWVELLMDAKRMGLSIEEIRQFLASNHSVEGKEQKVLAVC